MTLSGAFHSIVSFKIFGQTYLSLTYKTGGENPKHSNELAKWWDLETDQLTVTTVMIFQQE